MFETNNNENIILVYHIGTAGLSPMMAENEMSRIIGDYHEKNPRIKQIYLTDDGSNSNRVECIYPALASSEVVARLASIEAKLKALSPDSESKD